MSIYTHDFEVRFGDVGNSNQVSNKAFLGFMEDIGGMHSDEVGYGINDIERTHLSWVLLGWKVKILKRPNYGEIITVKTWARDTGRLTTHRDFEVYDNCNTLCAIATSKWVLIDLEKGRMTKINQSIIDAYHPETKSVLEEKELNKLQPASDFSSVYTYTVQRSNIDINHHMHNLYYLDLAYEALPEKVYDNISFSQIEIMYKKEVKLGDTLKCFYQYDKIQDVHNVTVKSKDEKFIHAIIQLKR